MSDIRVPDHSGGSILNVIAEIERRLLGDAPSPGLHPELAALVPKASTYVLVLLDGLGDHQLDHPGAKGLAADRVGTVDAPFPSTTSVALATIGTGLPPRRHGLIGHLMSLPGLGIVNTLKWIGRRGTPVDADTTDFLPSPNTWERLRAGGIEPIAAQPGDFIGSPLTKMVYRGARFEPFWSVDDAVDAVTMLAGEPGRFVFAYLPHVDFAAHVAGQSSSMYDQAIGTVADVWEAMAARLPQDAVMIGTADHGHLDFREEHKVILSRETVGDLELFGDPRALYARGTPDEIERLAQEIPATWHPLSEMESWLGEGPAHPDLAKRLPDGVFLADQEKLILPSRMDKRLIGYHGGLSPEEVRVPLLVAG